jgi:hypothetical protein
MEIKIMIKVLLRLYNKLIMANSIERLYNHKMYNKLFNKEYIYEYVEVSKYES